MNASIDLNSSTSLSHFGAPFEQFGEADPGWIECLIDAFITLFRGPADFVSHQSLGDFLFDLNDSCSIALLADWGANDTAAHNVASQVRAIDPDLCIHLGDIYYAGQENESQSFLHMWPKYETLRQTTPPFSSYALNGNHEMFCGGHAYFGSILTAFGQPASYFGLRNKNWQILGFDSAYIDQRLLNPEQASALSDRDSVVGKQWTWLQDKIASSGGRKTILLSHHQPFSAFEAEQNQSEQLRKDVTDLLIASGNVKPFAWFFGHEHRCTIYDDSRVGFKARLIGNGCIPHLPPPENYHAPKDCVPFLRMNTGHTENGDALSGFALLRIDGPNASVKYVNENGSTFYDEEWKG